ncbi:MAG: hypothetical protein BGP05_12665 [Rhizobiales bacterium 62-47]|nr:MAG: hypothetical protein BGP05_12665 [Rhizobiales bacterium 62-47]
MPPVESLVSAGAAGAATGVAAGVAFRAGLLRFLTGDRFVADFLTAAFFTVFLPAFLAVLRPAFLADFFLADFFLADFFAVFLADFLAFTAFLEFLAFDFLAFLAFAIAVLLLPPTQMRQTFPAKWNATTCKHQFPNKN